MQRPKISKFMSVCLTIMIISAGAVYFFRLTKIKNEPASGVLYEEFTSAGECEGYCTRHTTLYDNGRLNLEKEKSGSVKDKKTKTVLLRQSELKDIEQTIRETGIADKKCKNLSVMDVNSTYQVNIDNKSVEYSRQYNPIDNGNTERCDLEIDQIRNKIGYQDW